MSSIEGRSGRISAKILKGARRSEPNLDPAEESDLFQSADVSELPIHAPKQLSEATMFSYVKSLCEHNKHEAAAKFVVENLSELLASRVNRKEKLNQLMFLPRLIQGGGGTKHGYQKLLRKVASIQFQIEGIELPKQGAFVDMGCGAHDPLGLATYFYLNGFEPSFGIDLLEPRNTVYSALSMYDILSNARTFPRRYCRNGTEPAYIQKRLNDFAIGAFEAGNFEKGFGSLDGRVKFEAKDIVDAGIEVGSVSLLVSFAVLEHVSDIDGVCKRMFELLRPNGVVFHFVDLADHRAYRGDRQFGPLSFLADEEAPKNMNRLRAPEITEAHRRAGFEILKDVRGQVDMPDDIRAKLRPRFSRMTIEEVSTIKQHLVVRKPGS